jgi:S-formylglutathione hydrolase
METVSENRCFGGVQGVYRHRSIVCDCDMTFGLFLPQEAEHAAVPVIWYLSGLTCTHENAMTKAGLQQWAAAEGVALVFPDTSPRGEGVADDPEYDLGQGAGFYVNATEAPWAAHFQMRNYILDELPKIVTASFPIDESRQSIMGHSMGGHGALTLAMAMPGRFASVSALSPICQPSQSDWGRKQLTAYLGADEAKWQAYDAAALIEEVGFDGPMLIDTGTEDPFANLLRTEALVEAIGRRRQPSTVRFHKGYDHSYYFIMTFAEEHIAFHAEALFA